MTDNEIIIECAKLDGWKTTRNPKVMAKMEGDVIKLEAHVGGETLRSYLHSRDAIVPVIEKQSFSPEQWQAFSSCISSCLNSIEPWRLVQWVLFSTPRQLCIALLKATGKWRAE